MKAKNIKESFNSFLLGNDKTPRWIKILIVIGAILVSFALTVLISSLVIKDNPINVVGYLFDGAFSRPVKFLFDAAILLAFGVAIIPCFKMKYWNMGANGQFLIACIISMLLMKGMEDFGKEGTLQNIVVIITMLVVSTIASMFWAQIPATFKALFNTNETLFTLMMNYVAAGLLLFTNISLSNGNSSTGQINRASHVGWLVVDNTNLAYWIVIVTVMLITLNIYIFMNLTKHGFEAIVLGDSFKTAKYVSMDTKKIINRSTIISGVITGILGFLLVSAINQSATNSYMTLSFNSILIGWMSSFNPLIMIFLSLFLSFITNGMNEVTSIGGLGSSDLVNLVFGLIFFTILACEFFIKYRVSKSKHIEKLITKTKPKGVSE